MEEEEKEEKLGEVDREEKVKVEKGGKDKNTEVKDCIPATNTNVSSSLPTDEDWVSLTIDHFTEGEEYLPHRDEICFDFLFDSS